MSKRFRKIKNRIKKTNGNLNNRDVRYLLHRMEQQKKKCKRFVESLLSKGY